MASTTIRVDARTHEKLRAIASETDTPIGRVITDLVEKHEREQFWRQMHEDFARLRSDPDAWQSYQEELAEWDATVGDGLEHEAPYYVSPEEATGGDTESG